jgi:hypothetical protein
MLRALIVNLGGFSSEGGWGANVSMKKTAPNFDAALGFLTPVHIRS